MMFEKAVEALKQGKKIRRSHQADYYDKKFLEENSWVLCCSDVFDDDWEIVEEDEEFSLETSSTADLLSELKSRKAIHVEYDCLSEESFIFGKYDGKIW